ncbi:hypothetical protein BDZ88DRAFT_487581 [Geranomyces variabilis]|nr:hypothetical protein BDZ88DRAFT_487581 [Geranomyces variabilis]
MAAKSKHPQVPAEFQARYLQLRREHWAVLEELPATADLFYELADRDLEPFFDRSKSLHAKAELRKLRRLYKELEAEHAVDRASSNTASSGFRDFPEFAALVRRSESTITDAVAVGMSAHKSATASLGVFEGLMMPRSDVIAAVRQAETRDDIRANMAMLLPGKKRPADTASQYEKVEEQVQQNPIKIIQALKPVIAGTTVALSSKGGHSHLGWPAYPLGARGVAYEVKTDLQNTTKYQEAIGQVIDRAVKLFDKQPQRAFVVGAIVGATSMELIRCHSDGTIVASGWTKVLDSRELFAPSMSPLESRDERLGRAAAAGTLHRDVTYGNVVLHNGHGLLIDWHVATQADSPVRERLSITFLFAALKHVSLVWAHEHAYKQEHYTHTLAYDLESWFCVLVHIAIGGHLLWRRDITLDKMPFDKPFAMGSFFNRQLELVMPDFKSVISELHNLLFDASTSYFKRTGNTASLISNIQALCKKFCCGEAIAVSGRHFPTMAATSRLPEAARSPTTSSPLSASSSYSTATTSRLQPPYSSDKLTASPNHQRQNYTDPRTGVTYNSTADNVYVSYREKWAETLYTWSLVYQVAVFLSKKKKTDFCGCKCNGNLITPYLTDTDDEDWPRSLFWDGCTRESCESFYNIFDSASTYKCSSPLVPTTDDPRIAARRIQIVEVVALFLGIIMALGGMLAGVNSVLNWRHNRQQRRHQRRADVAIENVVSNFIANGKTYQEFADARVTCAQQLAVLDDMPIFTDNQRELLEQRKRGFRTALAVGVQNYEEKAKKAQQAQLVIRGINNTTSATASVASDTFQCTASTAASIACDAFATLSTATNAFASVDGNASHDFEQQVTVEDVDANDEDYTSDVDDSLPECTEILEYRAKLADMAKSPCAVVQQTARHSELLRKRWHVYNAAILGLPKSKSLEMPANVVVNRDTNACLAKMPGLQASRTALHELLANGEVQTSRSWYDWPPFRTSAAAVTPEMVVMLMGALAVDATTSALSRVEATAKLLVSSVIATIVAMMAPSLQVHHEFVPEFAGTASDGSGRSDVVIAAPSRREALRRSCGSCAREQEGPALLWARRNPKPALRKSTLPWWAARLLSLLLVPRLSMAVHSGFTTAEVLSSTYSQWTKVGENFHRKSALRGG